MDKAIVESDKAIVEKHDSEKDKAIVESETRNEKGNMCCKTRL